MKKLLTLVVPFLFASSLGFSAQIRVINLEGQGGGIVHHSVLKSFLEKDRYIEILNEVENKDYFIVKTDLVFIGNGTKVARGVKLAKGVQIGEFNVIGVGSKLGKVKIGNHNKIDMAVKIDDGSVIKDYIWLERGVSIGSNNTIATGSHLHAGVRVIGPGVEISNKTEIGAGSELYEKVKIGIANIIGHGSIFQKETSTGKAVRVGDCFEAQENVSIGDFSTLGDNVEVIKDLKVGPNTRVIHGSTVENNLSNGASIGCDPIAIPFAVPAT